MDKIYFIGMYFGSIIMEIKSESEKVPCYLIMPEDKNFQLKFYFTGQYGVWSIWGTIHQTFSIVK